MVLQRGRVSVENLLEACAIRMMEGPAGDHDVATTLRFRM